MSSSTNGFTAHALRTHEYQASQPAVPTDIASVITRLTYIKSQHDPLRSGDLFSENRLCGAIVVSRAREQDWHLHENWEESLRFYNTFRACRKEAIPFVYNRDQAYKDTNTFLQTLERSPTVRSYPMLSEDVVKSMRMGLQLDKLDEEASRRYSEIRDLGHRPFTLAHLLEESVFEPFSLGVLPRDVEQWRHRRSSQGLPQNAESPQRESTIVADRGPEEFFPLYHAHHIDTGEAGPNLIEPEGNRFSNFALQPAIPKQDWGGDSETLESGRDERDPWQNGDWDSA